MFLPIPVDMSAARSNATVVPCVALISPEGFQSPMRKPKPQVTNYVAYGPFRIVAATQTASSYAAKLQLAGVPDMRTAPPSKAVVATRFSVETAVQSSFKEWMDAVAVTSDASKMVSHPAYKRIVALGEPAIPAILQSLRKEPSLLAWALFDIAGVNPVPPADYGKIDKITKAWLKWGRKNQYIK